jgi:methionyl-tRNA formyltransferase
VRTAYLGTSEFAATVLRRLAASEHKPLLVLTPPDSRRGRGRREQPPAAAAAAAELGLELCQSANVNEGEALERIRAVEPEALLVCAFGQLIREPLLSEFELLNVHPSLLPRWRGAAPIERAIMAGDERTGVCVMRLTAGLDSGPVALREEVSIGEDEGFEELSATLAERGGELLVRALDAAAAGTLEFAEQDDAAATYAEKVDPAERRLDPSRPAAELAAKVRALNPHVGTYLETADGGRLGVRAARALEGASEEEDIELPAAGSLVASGGRLLLGCAAGVLGLDVVQPPGGKPMAADAFLRGHEPPRLA